MNEIPVTYFAIFDGHAGPDAAVMASKLLHKLIEVRWLPGCYINV